MFPSPLEVTGVSYRVRKYYSPDFDLFPYPPEINGGYYGDGGKRWIISNNKFPYPLGVNGGYYLNQ